MTDQLPTHPYKGRRDHQTGAWVSSYDRENYHNDMVGISDDLLAVLDEIEEATHDIRRDVTHIPTAEFCGNILTAASDLVKSVRQVIDTEGDNT